MAYRIRCAFIVLWIRLNIVLCTSWYSNFKYTKREHQRTNERTNKINKFNRNQKRIGCAAPSIRFNYLSILFRLQTEYYVWHRQWTAPIECECESIASTNFIPSSELYVFFFLNKKTIVMQYRCIYYLHYVFHSLGVCLHMYVLFQCIDFKHYSLIFLFFFVCSIYLPKSSVWYCVLCAMERCTQSETSLLYK